MIVIDHLNGIAAATEELERHEQPSISIIAWIEVMAGVASAEERTAAEVAMVGIDVIDVGPAIAERAIEIRRQFRLKLPDAIILATARHLGCTLITRNTKDFDPAMDDIVVPYEL